MKKSLFFLFMVLLVATTAFAATESEDVDLGRVMALTGVGPVSPVWIENARQYLETYTGFTAAIRPSFADPAESLDDIGRSASTNMLPQDLFMIVLAHPTDADLPHGVYVPEVNTCVLNVAKLTASGDPEKAQRRIGQEVLRSAAILIGMPPCPFPLCVLTSYEKAEDLDYMSGNFCPPCQDKFTELAQRKHLIPVTSEEALLADTAAPESVLTADGE